MPRFNIDAADVDGLEEQRLIDYEMRNVQISSVFTVEALDRIWKKWGPLSHADLADFLGQHSHVQPSLAASLARACLRYFNEDHEGAAFALTPRAEALVRAIVLAIPLPVYRTQRAHSPGQYPGLGALLPELFRAGMDESWYRYLYGFLASPRGANARNELLHGFVDEPSQATAALTMIGVLYLAVGVSLRPAA